MKRPTHALSSLIALSTCLPHHTSAQVFGAAERRALLDSVASLLARTYVFPARGRAVADSLRREAAADRYAGLSPAPFALAVTTDLRRALAGDHHFSLLDSGLVRRSGVAAMLQTAGAPSPDERTDAERRLGYSIAGVEWHAGNVISLRLDRFGPIVDGTREAVAAAARLAFAGDAVILDLRENHGGAEGLNQLLTSYFFDSTSDIVLYSRYRRLADSTMDVKVLHHVDGRRMPNTPLYILVSRHTGSAAENVAYSMQALQRATIVGDTTVGAANSSAVFPLPYGFAIQVPVSRVIQRVTGTNWEGIGVVPDIATRPDDAFGAAYTAALHRLAASAVTAERRAELEMLLRTLNDETNKRR